jgi:glyoxylase-like metal-dependent hydrolase (beta-lactamase superfamily II)
MVEIMALPALLTAGLAGTPQRPPQFDMAIKTTKVTDNLYVLEGAGGNVLVFVAEEGVLLVDDKLPPAAPDVKSAVATISPKPIRFVVNTHWHRDHSGGNEALASEGSVIVAHENVRRRLSVDGFIAVFDRKTQASPPRALPVVTFTRDVTLHLGGEEISVVHVNSAHTDGDSLVRFRQANVLHLGDCYLNGSFPVVDSSNGGAFVGLIAAADTALGLLDAETRVVPGHGPIASRDDLRAWRGMLSTVYERVRKAVAAGRSLDQIKAERPTREWDERFTRSFVTPEHAVEEAYRSATSKR